MSISDRIREMVIQSASPIQIKLAAVEENMETLRKAGIRKILEGCTTMEEVLGVTIVD